METSLVTGVEKHSSGVTDTFGRPLRDLRISVADRCNFRCIYCMPKEIFGSDYQFLDRKELLTFEEIERLARVFVGHGIEKIRLTGGEPLVRRNLENLIEMLAAIPGLDLTLTTNGSMLARKAEALKAAGLNRVTVSLDSLDNEIFKAMNDVGFPVEKVLAGIDEAARVGLNPDQGQHGRQAGCQRAVHPADGPLLPGGRPHPQVHRVHGRRPQQRLEAGRGGSRVRDRRDHQRRDAAGADPSELPGRGGQPLAVRRDTGEVGIIASVTKPFCGGCTRARISAEGKLYTCLFAVAGQDLRQIMRDGVSDAELSEAVGKTWSARKDRYSEIRSSLTEGLPKVEMSYIGG